jgi:uncharacterized membrane protein YhaH (DUF805 family)
MGRGMFWLISQPMAFLGGYLLEQNSSLKYLAYVTVISIFAVSTKRLHDRNRSGFFILLFIIPIVNLWLTFQLFFFGGSEGPNRFGPPPGQAPAAPAKKSAPVRALKRAA